MKEMKWIVLFLLLSLPLFVYQNCAEKKLELDNQASNINTPNPEPNPTPQATTKISSGYLHGCFLKGGSLKCWGKNSWGEVGNGNTALQLSPVAVSGMNKDVTDVAAGTDATCAVRAGALYCWGYNSFGQLGNGTSGANATTSPQAVSDMSSGVTKVAMGNYITCAIKNGALYCWGKNEFGTIGNNNHEHQNRPQAVVGMGSGVTAVDITNYQGNHVCAIKDGGLYCWGENDWYQLGDGTQGERTAPTAVIGLTSGVTDVSVGRAFTCAIKSAELYCWGYNNNGRLGLGDNTPRSAPTKVTFFNGKAVQKISLSSQHTCAIANNQAYCWGGNYYGQVGNGNPNVDPTYPVLLVGLDNTQAIEAAGTYDGGSGSFAHTIAITDGNRVLGWGNNSVGQLGNGKDVNLSAPAESFSF